MAFRLCGRSKSCPQLSSGEARCVGMFVYLALVSIHNNYYYYTYYYNAYFNTNVSKIDRYSCYVSTSCTANSIHMSKPFSGTISYDHVRKI